jgi:hypothetical protein
VAKPNIADIVRRHGDWLRGASGGTRASLDGADLSGARLAGANLSDADLSGTLLAGADLSGADLSGADLSGARLVGANLTRANLTRANLTRADLTDARLPHFFLCPEVGTFTAFKALMSGLIATLEVPADARRTSSLVGRKCRAEFARVVSIQQPDGRCGPAIGYSMHDPTFVYKVGELVRPARFSDDIRVECAPGIHFFITRREAVEY